MDHMKGNWHQLQGLAPKTFRCGYCDDKVGSKEGYNFSHSEHGNSWAYIHICPSCNRPTYFEAGNQIPGVPFGGAVSNVPAEVQGLYSEARKCAACAAYTASVLALRKLLMHIAVNKGAKAGDSFLGYVEYLANKGFVPPDGRDWVDHMRTKGNEANHEIVIMKQFDSEELLTFAEMLLRFIYEFPSRIPRPAKAP